MSNVKSFRLSDDDAQLFEQLFPVGSYSNLSEVFRQMLLAVKSEREGNSAAITNADLVSKNEEYGAIIDQICTLYETTREELAQTCENYKKQFFEYKTAADKFSTENGLLRGEIENAKANVDSLRLEYESTKETADALQNEIGSSLLIKLNPMVRELLNLTAQRLSEKYQKEISAQQILVDMFMRYTVFQYTEWFYPFVLKEREILDVVQRIKPEIQSMSQFKKMF